MANLLSTGVYGFLCSTVKDAGKYINSFISGASGWMIKHNGDAEFKSIYARDKIITNEFVYNRIRVTEDEEIVSSNGRILYSEKQDDGSYLVELDLREGDINPFAAGDLVVGYYHNLEKPGIDYSKMQFTVLTDPDQTQKIFLSPEGDSIPHEYMIIVRVGNLLNIERQSFIMISSRTNAQYFYDDIDSWTAYENPNNVKCFLGKVSKDTYSLVPAWAVTAVSRLKKKFFLIADGVILRGTFLLKDSGKDVETEIKAIPGMIETKISSVRLGGTNLMKRSSCISKEPVENIADNRPMAVNSDIYGAHRLNDGFAQINGKGDYYWYVEPTNASGPSDSGADAVLYNLWGGFTSAYEALGTKNFVAEYNDFYTLSFDYYFDKPVGECNISAKIYVGTSNPGEPDFTEYKEEKFDKTPGVWHHLELTIDLSKYKANVFESGKQIFFQMRTISGYGQNYAGWKMYHKNIKFEKGNKASDWSPAKEDYYEAVEGAKKAAFEAIKAVGKVGDSVKELEGYVDNAFSDGIIEEAEAKAISTYINTVLNSKVAIEATYNTLYVNNYLSEDAKANLFATKTTLFGNIEKLIGSINTAISDGKTTVVEKQDVDSKFVSFNTALASFNIAVEKSNKSIQDSFDNKYTSIKQTLDTISMKVGNIKVGEENFIVNGNFARYGENSNMPWDVSLNGNLVADNWSTGYNGGVDNPEVGYHAHLNLSQFGYPVLEFINKNSTYGHQGRWLGITQLLEDMDKKLTRDEEYTISMDVNTDKVGTAIQFGLYLSNQDGTGGFADSLYKREFRQGETDRWLRVQNVFKASDTYPIRELYIYGQSGAEGRIWVKNVSVQKGNLGYWTQSKEDFENDTADALLPTGIDVENKKITLTADRTEIQDNSGNVVFNLFKADGTLSDSVLDIAGVIKSKGLNVNENFIISPDGKFSSKDGYIEGEIKATRGDIGFLKLENGNLIGYENGVKRVAFMNANIPSLEELYDGFTRILGATNFSDAQYVTSEHDSSGDNSNFICGTDEISSDWKYDQRIWLEEVYYRYSGTATYKIPFTLQESGAVSFEIENTTSDSRAIPNNKVKLYRDASLNSLIGEITSNSEVLLEKGMYYLSVKLGYTPSGLLISEGINIEIGVNIRRVNFRQVLACNIIGKDGIISRWGAYKYLFFKEDEGFEVMYNNSGLRINDNGIYKKKGNTWVAI